MAIECELDFPIDSVLDAFSLIVVTCSLNLSCLRSIWLYVCMWALAHMLYMHLWSVLSHDAHVETTGQCWMSSSNHSWPYVLRCISWNLELTDSLDWLARKLQESSCLHLHDIGITGTCYQHPGFYVGARNPEWALHTCMARIYQPSHLSSLLLNNFYFLFLHSGNFCCHRFFLAQYQNFIMAICVRFIIQSWDLQFW